MQLSVIICTHNPRIHYLQRTLDGLRAQTLNPEHWEFILVDNASSPPVSTLNLRLLDSTRIIVETELGLTPARIRGIAEAKNELILFVDDDNVLDKDYLQEVLNIAESFPQLGVFGGRITPEFEIEPPPYIEPFRSNLALAEFKQNKWSNQIDFSVFPCGAGMTMRRDLAQLWADKVRDDSIRRSMDRKGNQLTSSGDIDMILTAISKSYGAGRFTTLHLLHLIPKERLDFSYQKRLSYGIGYSAGLLNMHGQEVNQVKRILYAVRTLLDLLRSKDSWAIKRISLSGNYGYWRGIGKMKF